jgi:hypothetical protein
MPKTTSANSASIVLASHGNACMPKRSNNAPPVSTAAIKPIEPNIRTRP